MEMPNHDKVEAMFLRIIIFLRLENMGSVLGSFKEYAARLALYW